MTYKSTKEEVRAASKSPHSKFGCFLPISRQVVSADVTKKLSFCNI
jgi:hypothetical protein